MIKVVLLGSGNVAYQLALALKSSKEVDLIQRYNRSNSNQDSFDPAIPFVKDLGLLKPADIYILAINDEAISSIAAQMQSHDGMLLHTSGAIDLEVLKDHDRRGVLYPVQSLSMKQEINLKQVPFAIESNNPENLELLNSLAFELSDRVFELDSLKREKLHITAVFANNFSNFMFTCAENLCEQFDIPFDILRPLILETGKKVQYMQPFDAQTGPAKRMDHQVIQQHEKELSGTQKEIYQLLTEAIIKTYQKA